MADKPTKHIVKKRVIPGKVQNWDYRVFTVEKVGPSEKGVVIQFGRRVKHKVVKLDVRDLPRSDAKGHKIIWLTNFAVVDSQNRPVKRVHYTLFLPELPKGAKFVYYDHRGLGYNKKPKHHGTKPAQPGMVQVDFEFGDPGGGIHFH